MAAPIDMDTVRKVQREFDCAFGRLLDAWKAAMINEDSTASADDRFKKTGMELLNLSEDEWKELLGLCYVTYYDKTETEENRMRWVIHECSLSQVIKANRDVLGAQRKRKRECTEEIVKLEAERDAINKRISDLENECKKLCDE